MNVACLSCDLFSRIEEVKSLWAVDVYHLIAPSVLALLQSFVGLYVTFTGIMFFTNPGNAVERGRKFLVTMLVLVGVILLLSENSGTPLAWLVIREIEISALKLGALVLSRTYGIDVSAADAQHLYSILGQQIEAQGKDVFFMSQNIVSGASWIGVSEMFLRVVTALMMLVPWLFVEGLFLSFMIEAMFKFISIAMLSPLLLPALIWDWSRPYAKAAGRILLGGFLTIVMASFAMSLSVVVLKDQITNVEQLQKKVDEQISTATQNAKKVCPQDVTFGSKAGVVVGNWVKEGLGSVGIDLSSKEEQEKIRKLKACQDAWAPLRKIQDEGVRAFGQYYLHICILGFMAVLFHLQSKTLASNIAGVQDGPGAAAGAVAAGKIALGVSMMLGAKGINPLRKGLGNLPGITPPPSGGSGAGGGDAMSNMTSSYSSSAGGTQSPVYMSQSPSSGSGLGSSGSNGSGTGYAPTTDSSSGAEAGTASPYTPSEGQDTTSEQSEKPNPFKPNPDQQTKGD